MIGDWEVTFESNDPTSDFSYTYNWVTYFQIILEEDFNNTYFFALVNKGKLFLRCENNE